MISGKILKIDLSSADCVEFLTIYKESSIHTLTSPPLISVHVYSINLSYQDERNIISLINDLGITSIEIHDSRWVATAQENVLPTNSMPELVSMALGEEYEVKFLFTGNIGKERIVYKNKGRIWLGQ